MGSVQHPVGRRGKKQRTPRNMLEIPAVLETSSYTAMSPFGATRVRAFGLRHPVYSSYSYIRMIDVLQPFKAVESLYLKELKRKWFKEVCREQL